MLQWNDFTILHRDMNNSTVAVGHKDKENIINTYV